jgi:carbonic anhydrase/acetyltransferase-like protein (isoleucine patch superfamily)
MPYIHDSAVIIGDVTLGRDASVWPTAVLRGDNDSIVIGDESNVQDGAVIHVDPGKPVRVGKRVTIGHRAVIHGCTIEDDCLIGIGAIVLNFAVIGAGSVVGAGAVVLEHTVIPPGSLVLGVPAKVVKPVDDALRARTFDGAQIYVRKARELTANGEQRKA